VDEGGILIFRSPLAFPLNDVEVLVSTAELPLGTGSQLIDAIALFLGLLVPAALYGLYRLGAGQIDLAQQRSNFVSAVSHELRTPLTSIRMYGEILRSGWVESEEKRKSYYDYIFFESERLSRLITNVLQLARLTNNDTPLTLEPYTPEHVIDLVRSSVSSQVEAAGFALEIHTDPMPTALHISAEEDALSRIFINLVDNALKFSRDASNKIVRLGYRLEGVVSPEVVFFVRDFGPGIEKSRRKKLFELFYRGEDELTRATPGTGIGLALVQELAAKLKAKVDFENKQPGVEFTIRFASIDT
jgi:signal transduction histidine kinase